MNRDQLLLRKAELEGEMDHIRSQIASAKARVAETGEYSDRGWFIRANDALRHKGREAQRIQWLIGKAKKKLSSTFEQQFIAAARRRLQPDVFAELINEAHGEGPEEG